MATSKKFVIYDWAGNHCFQDKEFKTFEDAWEFLEAQFPEDSDKPEDEQDLQEFEVALAE